MSRRVVIVKREPPEDGWPEICQRAWNTPTPQEDTPTCEPAADGKETGDTLTTV